jgi:hypothetical protein
MSFLDEQPDKMMSIHENYSRDETVVGGSVRSFGIVMTTALAGVSLLNWWLDGHSWRWTGGLAALLLAATLFHPAALKPFNWLWLKFGLALHKVTSPIVMAFIFLRHGVADRPHHAGIGQGPIATQMAAQRDQLLDRAAPARAQARIDEGSVLEVRGMDFVAELWRFIRVRKKFWLLPILIMMVAFGGLVLLTKGSAVAPFIYTLF